MPRDGKSANDAGEVACNKPEAPAKGIERWAFSNALRWRFRLVSPVPAYSDGKSGSPTQRCSIRLPAACIGLSPERLFTPLRRWRRHCGLSQLFRSRRWTWMRTRHGALDLAYSFLCSRFPVAHCPALSRSARRVPIRSRRARDLWKLASRPGRATTQLAPRPSIHPRPDAMTRRS